MARRALARPPLSDRSLPLTGSWQPVVSGSLIVLFMVLAAASAGPLLAQEAASMRVAAGAPPAALPPLDPTNLAFWKSIRWQQISNDGTWFAYQLVPNEGDAEVVVRPTGEGEEQRFPIGEPTGPAGFNPFGPAPRGPLSFSADGKWLAFTSYPTAEAAKKAKKDKKTLQNGVTVVELSTGESRSFERVRGHEFAGDLPRFLVMQRALDEGEGAGSGADLLLLELSTGLVTTVGSVADYALDDSGTWIAWTTETKDRVGNTVAVRDLATDVVRTLDSQTKVYKQLAWSEEGRSLAVLIGSVDTTTSDTAFVALGFTGLERGSPQRITADPAELPGFPADLRISQARAPEWADDRSMLFFGLAPKRAEADSGKERPDVRPAAGTPGAMQSPPPSLGEDDLPTLVLWHGRDPRLQSQQQVEESRDKRYAYLAGMRVADGGFVRLATDELRDVTLAPGQHYAVGYDERDYQLRDAIDGGNRRDVYAIDTRTGAATQILTAHRWPVLPSPDGSKLLYYADKHYHVYDFTKGTTRTITEGLPTSFVDVEDDHNVVDPPLAPMGWASDSRSVVLNDDWDVWRVPVDGGTAVNLTMDGRETGVRHPRRIAYDPDMEGIDFSKPVYFTAYGERTKKGGLERLRPGQRRTERLLWDDASFTVQRAVDTETFVYSRETFVEFPDWWAARGTFAQPVRLTDANPQQAEYAWSAGAQLVDYVSDKGDSLQAALFLPADYQPGQSYPTVVYIYEKLSQNLHSYSVPNETRAFNPSVYTSRGYAVLMPDIVYTINDPGMSAVWCVIPAVKAAIATGIVDEEHVGLHGHSWGGYQSAFLLTQTDIFASIVSGAPLTDMVSMYSSIYWNTGSADMAIFESSQGRFKGSFIENYDAYIRNSPAFHADQATTPVVLLHNEKDGAVDFNQGITFFNTLRELQKDVVLLQYVGENHGLREPTNQKDYTVRMMEFFDHYLRGAPAPDWWENGVPRLQMEDHLKSRQKKKVVS
ncbi:MAG: prolyl oligopeptidase family serine peptidase [Gemmatimonadota bacterium]